MDVTVLEVHLPEAEFNAPFTGRGRDDRAPELHEDSTEEANDGGSGLLAIAVLVGLAALAWYLRSSRDGEGAEHEDVMAEGPA